MLQALYLSDKIKTLNQKRIKPENKVKISRNVSSKPKNQDTMKKGKSMIK